MKKVVRLPWLLLILQLPPEPAYVRVKAGRRLRRIGALALKKTVYVLPHREDTLEDFQWLIEELRRDGGDGTLCEARFVEGTEDDDIVRLFEQRTTQRYEELREQAERVLRMVEDPAQKGGAAQGKLERLRKNFRHIVERDFFGAQGRDAAESVFGQIEARLTPATSGKEQGMTIAVGRKVEGATWVTRKNIFVDRMACGWLIQRFIDKTARFTFVEPETYQHVEGELRFDTFEGEFTHRGDKCSFEVLCEGFGLEDPALKQLAEIIHDIDMKDHKYGREEAAGLALVLRGIRAARPTDEERLADASRVFDGLYQELRAN